MGAPTIGNGGSTIWWWHGSIDCGGMEAPMGGFMSSMVAPIPPSSGGVGASSGGGMGWHGLLHVRMKQRWRKMITMEEKMRRDAGLHYFYP
jgi:hypothetical protein